MTNNTTEALADPAKVWRDAYFAVYGCEPTHADEAYRGAHEAIGKALSAAAPTRSTGIENRAGEVEADPAYMEWIPLRDMLWNRFRDDEREDDELCVTRAEACALLSWAQLFDREAQPRRDEEQRTYDIIRRAAERMAKGMGCPFCASTDAFVERADFSSCYVICNDCGARGPTSCDETSEDADATENGQCEPGELSARRLWEKRS